MEKISISKIITNTFLIPWNNIQLYSQILAVPILLLVCVWGVWVATSPQNPALNLVFYVFYFMSFAYLAIICHQLVLIENAQLKKLLTPGLKKLIRFIMLMVVVYLMVTVFEYLIINIYINIFKTPISSKLVEETIKQNREETMQQFEAAKYIAYIPSMYIFGRLCLVFPAVALGYKPSLKWSWYATRHNHFHILFIVAIFPWALQLVLYALYRENSTLLEQVLLALLAYLSAALGVIAISLTYKELYRIEQQKL